MSRNKMASPRSSTRFLKAKEATNSISAEKVITPQSTKVMSPIESGCMRELTPRMSRRLKMLDPTILPKAICPFFLLTAMTEDTNSGNEVPPDTIVRPMNASYTPHSRAIVEAESTNISPPKMSPHKPRMIEHTHTTIDL